MNHTQYVSTLLGLKPSKKTGVRVTTSLIAVTASPRISAKTSSSAVKKRSASYTSHNTKSAAKDAALAHTPQRKRAPDLDAALLRQELDAPKRVRSGGGGGDSGGRGGGGVLTLRETLLARHQQRVEQRRRDDAHSLIVSADAESAPDVPADARSQARHRDDNKNAESMDEERSERGVEEEAGEAYTLTTVRGECDALATPPRAFTLVSATPAPLRPRALRVLPWEDFARLSPHSQQRHYAALVEAATRGEFVHVDTPAPFS